MEKISRILPSNPRVVAVDTSESQSLRPGAPQFGRSQAARTEVQDKISINSASPGKGGYVQDDRPLTTYKNPKEVRHSKIADDLSKKFFLSYAQENAQKKQEQVEETAQASENFNPMFLVAEIDPATTEKILSSGYQSRYSEEV